jgi:hypothetical protein
MNKILASINHFLGGRRSFAGNYFEQLWNDFWMIGDDFLPHLSRGLPDTQLCMNLVVDAKWDQ